MKKSAAFYQRLCGPPARGLASGALLFEYGVSELGIGSISGRPVGIDHFCVAVKDFSLEGVAGKPTILDLEGW